MADAKYDAEWIHELFKRHGINGIIPVRGEHLAVPCFGLRLSQKCHDFMLDLVDDF